MFEQITEIVVRIHSVRFCRLYHRIAHGTRISSVRSIGEHPIKGAQASADIYSIVETAKANNLNPYYYMDHLLAELPKLCDEDGNIDTDKMDPLLHWADELPECCKNKRH